MTRWRVSGEVTVSAYTYVEAETAEEACRLARDRDGGLAPHGAERDGVDPWEQFVIDDADGVLMRTWAQRRRAARVADAVAP